MAGKKMTFEYEYRKGQEIKVRIIDIGMRGEGIGKLEDGYTVFIKDAVVGDYVRASIMKANKSYAYAHLDQILQASPHRVEPLCPVARQCGGCQLQALSYEQELIYKQNKVRVDLIRIADRRLSGGRDRRGNGADRRNAGQSDRSLEIPQQSAGTGGKELCGKDRGRFLCRQNPLHYPNDGLHARAGDQ